MTFIFELGLDDVTLNQHSKYSHLGQRSFSSELTVRTHKGTHTIDCSTWTTRLVVGRYLTALSTQITLYRAFYGRPA